MTAHDPNLIHVVGAAIIEGDRCLVARRGPGMSMAGRWEFPGGKVERSESRATALRREIREEQAVDVSVGDRLGRGEAQMGSKRIRLEVFAATLSAGAPEPHEHAEVVWASADELNEFAWADADVPILPAVRARLLADAQRERCSAPTTFLSADWAKLGKKRAVYRASPSGAGWVVQREAPPRDGGWSLPALVHAAQRMRDASGAAVVVAIDAALGLPTVYGRQTGATGFRDAVQRLYASNGLAEESATASEWTHERPFFRVPSGRGGMNDFLAAAGGRSGVLRQIERRAGAKPVFAVAGIPGTVGSGSRALWHELVELPPGEIALWPFEGGLSELVSTSRIVLAESYPLASYAVALSPNLPTAPRRIAKTRGEARMAAIDELRQVRWTGECGVELRDVRAAEANEDDFDAFLTALALVRLAAEGWPLSHELVDPIWEGGLLGTGGCVLE